MRSSAMETWCLITSNSSAVSSPGLWGVWVGVAYLAGSVEGPGQPQRPLGGRQEADLLGQRDRILGRALAVSPCVVVSAVDRRHKAVQKAEDAQPPPRIGVPGRLLPVDA